MASVQPKTTLGVNAPDIINQLETSATNVGQVERWISAIGGGVISTYGITRKDWLGVGLAMLGAGLIYRGASGRSPLYKALNINTGGQQLSANVSIIPGDKGIRVKRSQTVQQNAQDLYTFWRDLEMAPLYMPGIKVVNKTGERTYHWTASGDNQWNAEILEDKPGELIAWHVHGQPTTANAGKVYFQPASEGRGTIVTLELDFFQTNPAGKLLSHVASSASEYEVAEILRRFRQLMEANEIATTKGQPTGKGRK
ncbi:hypothetical protein KDA_64380 [Dictyobacter alpinus]|uniref:Uncharacterized protein n=1 Tax=Dictyobacter alpinus TaxID=2014873 RepID=A0A402BHR6_9CHLR|nr:YgaP-like transmembrane domain [Dictyobacter alpinus]GCE30954.1 hypothetical protein KDA_64380 [Dictyobacter alpinus]